MELFGLLSSDWLSLRDIFRLLLLSGLFTAAALLAFPRNARTRRALLLSAVTALTVIPIILSATGNWVIEFDELPSVTLASGIPNVLVVIWLVIATVLGLVQTLRVRSELKEIAQLTPIQDDRVSRMLKELTRTLAIKVPSVKEGDLACSVSLSEPTIILPPDWQQWEEETLRGVLAHELVHIARRDDVWLLVMRGLSTLYWWMPWLKALESTYVRVMEESCDDAASELIGKEVEYVGALVKAASQSVLKPDLSTAMHAHHLVGRVGRFTRHRFVELDTAGVYWCVTTIVIFVGLLTSFEPVIKSYVHQPSNDELVYVPNIVSSAEVEQPSFYPVVHDHVELAPNLARLDRDRVYAPEYEPPVIYPGSAIRKRLEGEVSINYRVGRDGSVSLAKVVETTHEMFADAALRAVRQTRYAPGYTTGRLIRTTTTTQPHIEVRRVFRFRIQPNP